MQHTFLVAEKLLQYFPLAEGMSVGECGVSGSGDMMRALSTSVGQNGKVFAFDVNKQTLSAVSSQARLQGHSNIFPVWTNLEILGGTSSIADHQLDAAIAVHLFHESAHHLEILTELHRMLKRSAPLYIVDWTKESTHPLAPPDQVRLSSGYIAQLAERTGYTVTNNVIPDTDHWGIILTTT